MIITQPRIMATDGTAKTTAKISGELFDQRGMFGIRHSKEKESFSAWNKCVSVTDGTLPNWIREGKLGQYSLIMIDEAHERSCNIDLILGFLKRELPKYPQLRVIISSATINTESFLKSFKEAEISCELFDIPSRKKFKKFEHFWGDESVLPNCGCWLCKKSSARRREFWQKKQEMLGEYDLPEACANLALEILEETNRGSIIIFLHGASAVEDTAKKIKSRCKKGIEVIPVYKEKRDAKRELERTEGKRRVIVATNIAETSITIPDLVYCINSGWIKQIVWDPATQTQKLESRLHSKDGNSQRGGRLGRTQDGYVYHLYAKDEAMDEHTSPEITRSCLDDALATVKSSGIAGIDNFPWMEKTAEWKDMASEMQRSDQALSKRGVTDEKGHVLEKALSLLRIPRSSTEASVLFMADEQGILFETLVVLMLMSDRDGTPHMGSKLYDPFCGLLCWDIAWTAETKAKVSAIHQGLKVGCRDDLDFAIKLAFCFQQAKSNGLSEEWANYHCINCKNLERVVSQIEELIEGLGEERDESLRQLNLDNLDKVRALFFAAWPDRIATLQSDGQIFYQTKTGKGIVSSNSAGCWDGGDNALLMAFAEEETIVANFPQRVSVASFVVCMPGSGGHENLLCDQVYPVGCWVKTKKKRSSFAIEFSKIPLPSVLRFKKDVWSEERPEESAVFQDAFRYLQSGNQLLDVKASWIGEESEIARIIRWENKNGVPVAVLSSLSETEMQKSVGKKGSTLEVGIHCVARDPIGKNGWILGWTSNSEIPIELSNMSLSEVGWGLELIEGETLLLTVKGFEASGLPQLSNIEKAMDGAKQTVKKIFGSTQETQGGRKFVDLSGTLVGILTDQERSVVAVAGDNGVVQAFEVGQGFVPGQNLKYLRLNEEVTVRLFAPDNGVEIVADCLSEEEIRGKPRIWKEGRTEGKISVPSCIDAKDLAKWNARPETIDYVLRRSWQYCLQARIVLLKERMSSLKEWMSVEAIVERIRRNEDGETFVHVVFGDNIPGAIPENRLPLSGYSEGDELSLCITSLDPLRLVDKDTEIQQKEETIARWEANVSNSEGYMESQAEQIGKIKYALDNYSLYPDQILERQGWLAEKYANISRAQQQIAEQNQKISSVRQELKKLRSG